MRLTNPNGQIIAQHDGDYEAKRYFYLRERLGSVRQVIDMYGSVERNYTYSPFGQLLESGAASGAPSNPFMFTGQWFDDEISQYFLRARMYDPVLMRFTARDPVRGKFKEPMTLHKYLYCLNDPINRIDLNGEWTTAEISYTSGIRGYVFGALLGGTQNALRGESFWKGAISGGFATGTPAFFGVYGVAAAMAGGGINACISATLDRRSFERVLAETGVGIGLGAVMYGITSWSIGNWMDERMIPAYMEQDFHRIFDPLMGSTGGNLADAFSILMWGEDEKR